MQRMIAICGLICSVCPAFTATQKDDEEEKKRIEEGIKEKGKLIKNLIRKKPDTVNGGNERVKR